MQKKINPIKVQSKKWLLEALLLLMQKKEYTKITIKEIAERAGLDRKTFYRNFQSKEDILYLLCEEICLDYIASLKSLEELSSYQITLLYFTLCHKYIDFLKLLQKNQLFQLLLLKFDEYLPYLNNLFRNSPNYRYKTDYELIYESGGFWNVTLHWLNNGTKETAQELSDIVSSLMPPSTIND